MPARWIASTTPDFFEPRQCLLAQVMDESRHMDVFRKRALANGGGLMQTSGGTAGVVGSIDLARDFTEMSSRLHISGEGAVLTMFRMGELMAYNEAEKAMYRLCAQDEARHVAFGVMHMRYMSETAPQRREEIQCYLDEAERQILAGSQNPAGTQTDSSEALAILLGGGKDKYDEGVRKLHCDPQTSGAGIHQARAFDRLRRSFRQRPFVAGRTVRRSRGRLTAPNGRRGNS